MNELTALTSALDSQIHFITGTSDDEDTRKKFVYAVGARHSLSKVVCGKDDSSKVKSHLAAMVVTATHYSGSKGNNHSKYTRSEP